MEQLDLFELHPPRCACGAELIGAVNDRRGLCDRCILRRTIEGHEWNEDPELARAHLAQWLAARPWLYQKP
jgi:hypothetical protein